MEPVSAALTSSSSICHDSELSGPTFGTKPLLVFPTKSQHVSSCSRFRFY
jgi:hypothetical protein